MPHPGDNRWPSLSREQQECLLEVFRKRRLKAKGHLSWLMECGIGTQWHSRYRQLNHDIDTLSSALPMADATLPPSNLPSSTNLPLSNPSTASSSSPPLPPLPRRLCFLPREEQRIAMHLTWGAATRIRTSFKIVRLTPNTNRHWRRRATRR